MEWDNAKLTCATIRSKIGGTARLRSYVELEGDGLTPAEGDCPNPLYAPADIKEPLLATSLKTKPSLNVKKVYEYDLPTEAGGEYHVYQKGYKETGISQVKPMTEATAYYDLQGRKVTKDTKGVLIEKTQVNGKNTYRKIIKH